MAINNKVKVPVIGAANKSILLNPQATEGAVFGKDLFFGDGSTVVTLQNLAAALGITNASAQPTILWNQLAAIPPNVIEVANLSTAGVVRRLPDGHWITQPPSDFIGRPGIPGRRGDRGPPGVPGSAGARGAGSIGIPGRRGPRGKQGVLGPPGARGATGSSGPAGATGALSAPGRRGLRGKQGIPGPPGSRGAAGPAGSASGASGFPGYRQKPVPKPRFKPWTDSTAANIWPQVQTFPAGGVNGRLSFQGAGITFSYGRLFAAGTAEILVHDSPFAVGTNAPQPFQLVTSDVARLGIDANGAVTIGPTSAVGQALSITSGNAGNTGIPDFYIARNGSTANNIDQGPSIQLQDTSVTSASALQHSGGQTEIWQYNGGWRQVLKVAGATQAITFNVGGSEAITINGAATTGTSQANMGGANNKPGVNNVTQAAKWLPATFAGVQYYIPLFI